MASTAQLPAPVAPESALALLRSALPTSPAVVLAVGPGAAQRWHASVAASGGAFVTVGGIEALVDHVEQELLLAERPVVSPAERIAILGDVLRGRPELKASLEADPQGVAAALCGIVDELAMHGFHRAPAAVVADVLAPALPVVRARLRLLHEVLVSFRDEVAKRGLDTISRLERATAALRAAPKRERTLLVDGWDRLVPLERELVLAVQENGSEVHPVAACGVQSPPNSVLGSLLQSKPNTVTLAPDGSFVRVQCRDPGQEAEAAAALVLKLLADGATPDAIAVQAPSGAGYADLLARVFADHGLTLAAADRAPAATTPLYQAFRAFLRLFYRGPDPFDLVTVFGAGGCGVGGGRRDRLGKRLLDELPSTWDEVRNVVRAATPAADPPEPGKTEPKPDEVKRHTDARTAALEIVDVLANGPSGREVADRQLAAAAVDAAVTWFCSTLANPHRLLSVAGICDRDAILHRDASAALRAAVTLLVQRASGGDVSAAASFRDAAAFLQAMEALLPRVQDQVSPGAIRLRLDDEASGPIDHLIVVGFSRGRWPTAMGASPLLGPLERQKLRELRSGLELLPLPEDVALRHGDDARAVFMQARKSVTILTPARSEAGEAAPPALLYVDLVQRFTKAARAAWSQQHEVTFGTAAAATIAPALGAGPLTSGTRRQAARRVARQVGTAEPLAPSDRAAAAELISKGSAGPLAAPWHPDAEFELPVALDVANREFSASQLEVLLSCRYRYFSRYVLDLSSLALTRQPSLDPATNGSIAHHVLEALEKSIITATAADVHAALERVIEEHYPWARHARYRVGVASVERALQQFLPAYQAVVAKLGWCDGESEVDFGSKVAKRVTFPLDRKNPQALAVIGADKLRLQGAVDRVDEVEVQGKAFRLATDFKYGNVAKFIGQRELGMGLQAAIYPHALEALGGSPVLGFAYFSLTNRNGNMLPSRSALLPPDLSPMSIDDGDIESFQERARELLTARLALLIGASRSGGDGNVLPHSPEERKELTKVKAKSCEYCDAWLLCRYEEVA